MSNQTDEKTLEEYLKGGSELSRRYKAGSDTGPHQELDSAIIKAARAAVAGTDRAVTRSWYVPLSLAATVVIGVSVVFSMYKDQGQQLLTEPAQYFMLEEIPHSDVLESKKSMGTAEQAAAPAPVPQTIQPDLKKSYQHEKLKQNEINTKAALEREAQKMSVEISGQLEKENPVQQTQKTQQIDLEADIPSMDFNSTPAREHSGENVLAPAAVAPLSRTQLPDQIQPATKQEEPGDLSDTLARKSSAMSETDWLYGIRQLWEAGKKDEAVASLEMFLNTYPQYPREEIITNLPNDFAPEKYISDFK